MKTYKLRHETVYTYEAPVDNYQSLICLKPRNLGNQQCVKFGLELSPAPQKIYERSDYFGNELNYFSIHEPHKVLKVVAESQVHIKPNLLPGMSNLSCEEALGQMQNDGSLRQDLMLYQLDSEFITWDDEIKSFAASCLLSKEPFFEGVMKLCAKIYHEFEFKSGFTTINTPLKTVLKERKGVCQDFSHLAIAALRSMGFAARYVSGYIETQPPPGKAKLQGSDASHAWISVFIPGLGWCEFDPTNNIIPQDRHIITAYGRDYADVAPLKGIVFGTGGQKIKVSVDVLPVA